MKSKSSPSRSSRADCAYHKGVAGGDATAEVAGHPREICEADLLAQARQPRGQSLRVRGVAGVQRHPQHAEPVGEVEHHLLDDLAAPLVPQGLPQYDDAGGVERRVLARCDPIELRTRVHPPSPATTMDASVKRRA